MFKFTWHQTVIVGGLASLFLSGVAAAQSATPFTAAEASGARLLSYPLETRFKEFLTDCGGIATPLVVSKPRFPRPPERRELSAIDPRVIDALRLQTGPTIDANLSMSLDRVFGHVYPAQNFAQAFGPSDQYLGLRYVDSDKILPLGFPESGYSSTCGSILTAALSANAEFNFPVESLRAAVSADGTSNTHASLEVTDGSFESPIWQMWSGADVLAPDRPRRKLFAALLFWDWYRGSASYRAAHPEPQYLLKSFTGTVAYRRVSNRRQSNGQMAANSRTALPFLSADASFTGVIDQTSSFTATRFDVLVRASGGARTYDFEPLPSLTDIVAAVQANAVSKFRTPDSGRMVENGQQKVFTVELSGVPAAYCDETVWEVRDDGTATIPSQVLSLGTPAQTPVDGELRCAVPLVYTAPNTDPAVDVSLSPVLVSRQAIDGERLKLPLKELRIERTAGPVWSVVSQTDPVITPAIATTPQAFTLRWTINFTIRNIGQYNDISRIDVDNLKLDCPAGVLTHDAIFEAAFSGPPGPSSRTLVLTITDYYQSPAYAGPTNPTTFDRQSCKLNGPIRYLRGDGVVGAVRDVPPVGVTFPRPAPTTPATP